MARRPQGPPGTSLSRDLDQLGTRTPQAGPLAPCRRLDRRANQYSLSTLSFRLHPSAGGRVEIFSKVEPYILRASITEHLAPICLVLYLALRKASRPNIFFGKFMSWRIPSLRFFPQKIQTRFDWDIMMRLILRLAHLWRAANFGMWAIILFVRRSRLLLRKTSFV
jgi:hypothetical protein